MAEAAVRDSITLAGRAERARATRGFAGEVLGPGHPCADAAVPLVSELFSNSLRHSESGAPGGTVTVTVTAGSGVVRVEVADPWAKCSVLSVGPDGGHQVLSPAAGRRDD
jgi:anti-sigma regulatory factor (Ser/Thr protein kinase)